MYMYYIFKVNKNKNVNQNNYQHLAYFLNTKPCNYSKTLYNYIMYTLYAG